MRNPLIAMAFPLVFAGLGACHHKATPQVQARAAQPQTQHRSGDRRPQQPLAITVNGQPAAAWTAEEIASLPAQASSNKNGESREGWPLKALAEKLVGPGARVVALTDADGERLEIAPLEWRDPQKSLVLRVSHRGDYKVHWAAPDGTSGDAVMKGVKSIDLTK